MMECHPSFFCNYVGGYCLVLALFNISSMKLNIIVGEKKMIVGVS